LIVASVVQIGRGRRLGLLLPYGAVGCVVGAVLTSLDPLQIPDALWVYFVGGMIAISAWILPAISGSFMLLILGLYQPVIAALNDWQWPVLTSLALGCVAGLMLFSKLLAWLMAHRREPVLALLTGFMAGSLLRLWPWTHEGALLAPDAYGAATGQDPLVIATCAALLAGGAALWLLSRLE
jgi:putative membrane protein